MTNVPPDPHIFHITHVNNLAGILREGGLWCDAQRIARQFDNTNIGHHHIKQRRMSRPVTVGAGGTLGDYVPFNFCPRSVMLYAVHRGHQDYQGGQEAVVHLVSSVRRVLGFGRPWAFTDRHAELVHASQFHDLSSLREVRWDVMSRMYWTDVKEERQAEFLVHQFFPWVAVQRIGVMTVASKRRVHANVAIAQHRPIVNVILHGTTEEPVMIIEQGEGNLLRADVDALVNTVNTEGVMGKGLALQFKQAFPEIFASYERSCKAGEVVPGRMHVVRRLSSPRFIFNFPTKTQWRQPSKIEYIRDGLVDLVTQVRALGIQSIAIPPLGCGHGGLDWVKVKPLVIAACKQIPDVRVVLFEPSDSPPAKEVLDRRKTPAMTDGRAAVIALMGRYVATGYDYVLSLVEVQKLAYFLQVAGEPLRLEYRAHYYGPYADNLRKALRNMEGHHTRGIGDGKNSPETPLELLPGAVRDAEAYLVARPETRARLERVANLIEGFETPFGMELLGTVHWVMHHRVEPNDVNDVVKHVHAWSERKRAMKDSQIQAAWRRLVEQGWAPAS